METEEKRKLFEEWYNSEHPTGDFYLKKDGGRYNEKVTRDMFYGFCGCLSSDYYKEMYERENKTCCKLRRTITGLKNQIVELKNDV